MLFCFRTLTLRRPLEHGYWDLPGGIVTKAVIRCSCKGIGPERLAVDWTVAVESANQRFGLHVSSVSPLI